MLGHYFTDVKSPVVFSGIVAMLPYIEKNKDVVKRFVRAINRAFDDFKDPKVVRDDDRGQHKGPTGGDREDGRSVDGRKTCRPRPCSSGSMPPRRKASSTRRLISNLGLAGQVADQNAAPRLRRAPLFSDVKVELNG